MEHYAESQGVGDDIFQFLPLGVYTFMDLHFYTKFVI